MAAPVSVLPAGVSIADIAAKVTPSVVNVFSEKKVASVPSALPFTADPFFRFFFNGSEPRRSPAPERREKSLGSGVIVSSDGVIITNNHVVEKADEIRVAMQDGRELEATLVGTDPKTDLAVLRVKAKDLPVLPVADSSKARVGDVVLAIGNPFGVGQTVTMGIVSAVGRANLGLADYEDFIQTDAAINPGNSGGALVDMAGHLLGINTAIMSRSGGYQGIGFAIPSQMAMGVEGAILDHGKVTRGWLGVGIQDLTPALGEALHREPHHGVLVSDVMAGSPAEKAGIVRGDVIVSVDGTAVNDTGHLRNLIAFAGKGKSAKLEILRSGKTKSVEVTLGELPNESASVGSTSESGAGAGVFSGLTVDTLDPAARSRLRLPDKLAGVVVSAVDPGSPAADTLRPGDVIIEIDHTSTPTVDAFKSAVHSAGKHALVLVYRDGSTVYQVLSAG
ncbi:MAG: DegQ family serine endoprotease [Polyangiaceae bacterium]